SLEMVVALLGVLRAGAAYLPLDPSYPPDRLAFMLEDGLGEEGEPPVLLTQERLLDTLPPLQGRILCLEAGWDGSGENGSLLDVEVLPDHPAYVIYTSGSTGRPKGVVNTHRAIVNRLLWMQQAYDLTADDRVLQKTPFSFDVSVWELFWPLLAGARLVVARPGGHQDPDYLVDLIEREGITTLHFVPPMLQAFLEHPEVERCASLRTVVCSGEAFPLELQERFFARFPERVGLHNLYGPTEAAIDVTSWVCERESPNRGVPIGRPIANLRIYLLDAVLHPVPTGAPGELHIGGLGLARGYLRRPGLTAEKLIPDPFAGTPGARLYRTGDLARHRTDGQIEYLGRIDHQVKIRGFRIELGEIEAALATHPDVREVVVVAREDEPGNRRLVAYLVLEEIAGREVQDILRASLQERLPEYMIPSAFVILPALPLSPNGKVDRKSLPAPVWEGEAAAFAAPRDAVEELLAGIWREVLRVEKLGIRDSFFGLGGHSLLATRVVSRVREVFGVELPLRALFEAPTVAGLAQRLRTERQTVQSPIVPRRRDQEGSPPPASFAQERLWFLDRFGTDRAAYNIPAVLRLRGPLDVPALAGSLRGIVRRHESLRTTFAAAEGRVLQRVAPALDQSLPCVDLEPLPAVAREAETIRLAREEARRLFDLECGPLLRATLVRLEAREHALLLSMHHIVSDGWSLGVLLNELSALYAAFTQGLPPVLPRLPIQYADFAVWQRGWLRGEVLETQLGYWRERLAGAPAVIELPADRPRPPVQSARGRQLPIALPWTLSDKLRALVRQQGATLFMALLAGFQTLLARTTGQEDLPVGTPIANRNRIETEGLIGFFVNALVLRGDLSGNPTFRELLARTRETTLGAYAHQDLPFEKLVGELRPERNLSHAPLFQVMVILQNAPMEPLPMPGLTVIPVTADSGTAKFDLRLSLMESLEGLTGTLVYNRDLFDASTVVRLAGSLETLLAAAATQPDLPLTELPLTGAAERHQLLEWGDSRPVPVPTACLHELFAAQAARTPDAVAAVSEGEGLTYRELSKGANRLARHLAGLGVRPGDLVGICLDRSLDLVTAVLGVLATGAAYLPLDPSYPPERLAFALEDSRAGVLVTREGTAGLLPATAARVLLLDVDREAIASESAAPLAVVVTPDFPAYVIYTSGSTGRPKGVLVTHANVTRLFAATDPWYGFSADDVWTLFHSYAFDFSVWELWGPLLHGGRLVIVPYWVSRSPEAFFRLLVTERVTVLNQTPSAFRQLIWADDGSPDLALRWVIFGGEALELASLAPWFDRHGDERPRLVNMYGITETTVHVTYRPITLVDLKSPGNGPVGVPIPDLTVHLLGPHGELVPVGVPGEIHVGGAGVARGYLGRPGLTAERFVPDPFTGEPGARLYRSGDLAKRRPDGDLEYLGRIDHQVKIRGFRIELGEIEAALLTHPQVLETVVMARQESDG
ncbi:MAG TPA: amino acid adenylation domain-containing protein, partial [Thermoanaerobaculia bacterium]|nr:amino acid adenylation domain-containing protein [Thermoanaerobaculia bacterium]